MKVGKKKKKKIESHQMDKMKLSAAITTDGR